MAALLRSTPPPSADDAPELWLAVSECGGRFEESSLGGAVAGLILIGAARGGKVRKGDLVRPPKIRGPEEGPAPRRVQLSDDHLSAENLPSP